MKIDPRFTQDVGSAIFTGTELLVKGALETPGGVHLMTGYPGSPVAGFFDTLQALGPLLHEKGVAAQMANNEALSVAMVNGAQMAGCRAITAFKSVGLHVAARLREVLAGRDDVDEKQISNIGFSYGGMICILTAYEQLRRMFVRSDDRFAAHVSYYGPTVPRLEDYRTTGAPVAILNGEWFGNSLANAAYGAAPGMGATAPVGVASSRPLLIIRFNQAQVDYDQALYTAARDVINARPDAAFELVAVAPAQGIPAEQALAASAARQNAEGVRQRLTEFGIPPQRVALTEASSSAAQTSEVHLYIR